MVRRTTFTIQGNANTSDIHSGYREIEELTFNPWTQGIDTGPPTIKLALIGSSSSRTAKRPLPSNAAPPTFASYVSSSSRWSWYPRRSAFLPTQWIQTPRPRLSTMPNSLPLASEASGAPTPGSANGFFFKKSLMHLYTVYY